MHHICPLQFCNVENLSNETFFRSFLECVTEVCPTVKTVLYKNIYNVKLKKSGVYKQSMHRCCPICIRQTQYVLLYQYKE